MFKLLKAYWLLHCLSIVLPIRSQTGGRGGVLEQNWNKQLNTVKTLTYISMVYVPLRIHMALDLNSDIRKFRWYKSRLFLFGGRICFPSTLWGLSEGRVLMAVVQIGTTFCPGCRAEKIGNHCCLLSSLARKENLTKERST